MVLKIAAWTHGLGVTIENRSWRSLRQGSGTKITPSNETSFGWIHIAIPSPPIMDDVRVRAIQAGIRFRTGPGAEITNFHVYDGEKRIAEHNHLDYAGDLQTQFLSIPYDPEIWWGTVISLGVQFEGSGLDDWIEIVSGGIDFHSRKK